MKKNKTKGLFASIVLGVAVTACASASSSGTVTVVDRPDIQSSIPIISGIALRSTVEFYKVAGR